MRLLVLLTVAMPSLVALSACDFTQPKTPAADQRAAKDRIANERRLKRAFGSAETYTRLKALAFDEAGRIQRGASPLLDRIAANSTLRMENPVAKSRDEDLNVIVCEGHLVLELPPGTQDAFDGDRRLEADIEYAAQAAVDGSGLVYQMKGAEPIVYRLVALALPGGRTLSPTEVATASPAARTMPAPASEPGPQPAPRSAPPSPPVAPSRDAPSSRSPVTRAAPPPLAPRQGQPIEPPAAAADRAAPARPSFSCRSARSRVERMVCADGALAAVDRRMSSAFYAALARGDGGVRADLRASRDRFLAFRDRCSSPACVQQAYEDRTAEIRDIAGGR